jgi:hypothetical protein
LIIFLAYEPKGAYPKVITDIDLSSGDETTRLPMHDASAD